MKKTSLDPCHSQWYLPSQTAEQRLWVAVLEAALEDAMSHQDPTQQEQARHWFRSGGQNFKLVCDLANFEASFVRKRVLNAIGSF